MSMFGNERKAFTSTSGIAVSDVAEDVPKFRRRYKAALDNRCRINVDIYTLFGDRCSGGELIQPNGNSVRFDIDRIAEKIIDPLLVPLVKRACDEIIAMDKAFIKSRPSMFVDENDVIWRST